MKAVWVPILCHGLFDFSLLIGDWLSSHFANSAAAKAGPALMLVPVVIFLVLGFAAFRKMLLVIREFRGSDLSV